MLGPPTIPHLGPAPEGGDGWVGVDTLVGSPAAWDRLVADCHGRFLTADRALVGGQVVREAVTALVTTVVRTWSRDRRVLDGRAGNVVVRAGDERVEVALRSDAPLARGHGRDPAGLLLLTTFGTPARGGAFPPGPPAAMASVAALVAASRRAWRIGPRHHWGTAALALSAALTAESHEPGRADRAEADRRLLLSRRPDLARTLELVTVADPDGDPVTAARRRTCCLLVDLPEGRRCGTCSRRDRHECLDAVTRAALAARDHRRHPATTG